MIVVSSHGSTYDEYPIDIKVSSTTITRVIRQCIYITHAMGYGYIMPVSMANYWGSIAWWVLRYADTIELVENTYYDALAWMCDNVIDSGVVPPRVG